MTQKEKFYIFTGIDRTLIGRDFLDKNYGPIGFRIGYVRTNPTSMAALNFLLENLEKKFDTRLVITSGRREHPAYCEEYLKYNGLKYDKPLFFTRFVAGPRGEKIVDFLEEQGTTPIEFHKAPLYVRFLKYFKDNPDFNNYVVIDEPKADISKYIPKQQYHKVNKRKGLTFSDSAEILESQNIDFEFPAPKTQKGE